MALPENFPFSRDQAQKLNFSWLIQTLTLAIPPVLATRPHRQIAMGLEEAPAGWWVLLMQ